MVTEQEAARIEAEWESYHLRKALPQFDAEAMDAERARLQSKLGRPPLDGDVMWSLIQRQRLEHSLAREWSLYRNDTLAMAELLLSEGKDAAALPHLLDVCTLDVWLEEDLEGSTGIPKRPMAEHFAPGVLSMVVDALDATKTEPSKLVVLMESRRTKLPMLARWKVSSSTVAAALQEVIA